MTRLTAVLVAAVLVTGACHSRNGTTSGPTTPLGLVTPGLRGVAASPTSPAPACGSDRETYLRELLHTAPSDLKVLHEWGDIVPGGQEVTVTGTVAATHLGPSDLPTSHPYGDDLSMNVNLDPPYRRVALHLGSEASETGPGQLHVELSSGLIPHAPRPSSAAPGQTWRQLSDFNLTGFQPGFDQPAIGDHIIVTGRWIIDCGHANFQSELHPMTFVAWSHQTATATTVHAYLNPFRDTELYGTSDDKAKAKPFPPYFVDQLVALATGQSDRLHARELVEANHTSPPRWRVCGPEGKGKATGRYDVVRRPGIDFAIGLDRRTGCATISLGYSAGYQPAPPVLRDCALPWSYLDAAASGSLDEQTKILPLIESNVAPAVKPLVERDPTTTCADALAGPAVSPTPSGHQDRTDGTQPIPFYGVITVSRS